MSSALIQSQTSTIVGTDLSRDLRIAETQHGEPLSVLSENQPLLLVFLRHFG